ncbi:MAG: undecaprenyl/decaprenyl-phosphate alpha-N-acetylglucosaminyl 1-phosphate transferase [Alphaproteobacteria bacterium]|nr:undecaprenyl/decaprenyl-phosphate alpha-N-acetylglucosaminyl 1-phosphate transferase [Alphaproteobacteria bacterium]
MTPTEVVVASAARFAIDFVFLCGVTLLICANASTIAGVIGIVDHPDGRRKRHPHPTPLVGGLAVVAPFVVWCVATALDRAEDLLYPALALTAAAYFALGLADDQHHVKPKYRLVIATVIALVVVNIAPQFFVVDDLLFSFATLPQALYPFPLLFTLLCLVGLLNAMNMADGINGLVLGLCLIWTVLLAIYGLPELRSLLAAFAAALGITLAFNLRGRLFLGDSGTYAVSMVIALLTIYSYNRDPVGLRADVVALWFLVPVLDCLRLIVWRIASHRSPFSSDKQHLHHLLRRSLPEVWVLPCYLALVALPCAMALAWPDLTPLWFALVVALYTVIMLWASRAVLRRGLRTLARRRDQTPSARP